MDAYPCKCMLYKTLSHTKGAITCIRLHGIIWNDKIESSKKKKKKRRHFFLCFLTESRSKNHLVQSQVLKALIFEVTPTYPDTNFIWDPVYSIKYETTSQALEQTKKKIEKRTHFWGEEEHRRNKRSSNGVVKKLGELDSEKKVREWETEKMREDFLLSLKYDIKKI